MTPTWFLFPFLVLTLELVAAKCPEGSIYYGDRNECIYPVNAKSNYTEATRICRNLNGRILQIHDIFENVMAGSEAATTIAVNSQSYIGVIKGPNETWIYDDGTPLQYQNWRSGHPQANASCAVQSAQNYQWTSVACDVSHTFICSIPDRNTSLDCPDGWVRYNGSCYYFYDPQLKIINQTFTLPQASGICQSVNAQLTSIHSAEEFNFLKGQIATTILISPHVACGNGQALIGLTCSANSYWWIDGTPFDYDQTKEECDGSYGIVNDPQCTASAYWDSGSLAYGYYRYICKKRIG